MAGDTQAEPVKKAPAVNPAKWPILYMIRHGEKLPKVDKLDKSGQQKLDRYGIKETQDPEGLSEDGQKRATGLMKVFGKESKYNIGLIITQQHDADLKEARPFLTVEPLAKSLAPNVKFIHDINTQDAESVVKVVNDFDGPGNILICWEHHKLTNICREFRMTNAMDYPDDRFDVIWTSLAPYTSIDAVTSEHIPDIDEKYAQLP